jgi:uncharacterized cupin superfamily protein
VEGRSAICLFEGEPEFSQVGINVGVLGPGEPMATYHWEADQEDFLVLAGEAVLIVEGAERPLRAWDFVHFPSGAKHVIVGAGDGPCVVVAVGARDHSNGPDWGGYTVDEARRHGASVEQQTRDRIRRMRGRPTAARPGTARTGFPIEGAEPRRQDRRGPENLSPSLLPSRPCRALRSPPA